MSATAATTALKIAFSLHPHDHFLPQSYSISRSVSENEGGQINLLFLNGGVITPLFPETNIGSSFHPLVIGPIRRALPHRDKHEAAFRMGRCVWVCGVVE